MIEKHLKLKTMNNTRRTKELGEMYHILGRRMTQQSVPNKKIYSRKNFKKIWNCE